MNQKHYPNKYILCDSKCKLDDRKCNSNQKLNENKCQCEYRNPVKDF